MGYPHSCHTPGWPLFSVHAASQPTPTPTPFFQPALPVQNQGFSRPIGAFGQRYPQNNPSTPGSPAVKSLGLRPASTGHKDSERIDVDGLPHVGAVIWPHTSWASTKDCEKGRHRTHNLKGEEVATVEQVRVAEA